MPDLVTISRWRFEAHIDRPPANPLDPSVMIPTPQKHIIPPGTFRSFADRAGFQSGRRIGRLRSRLEISGRRKCSMCLYPAGAR